MSIKSDRPNRSERSDFTPFDIWEKGGLTEHLGGIHATRRLLNTCHLTAGQQVLEVGCGTGYTACYLAKDCQVRVVALDINSRSTKEARKRVLRHEASLQVSITQADAHKPPFSEAVFDAILVESVLVFCDAPSALTEMRRVLKPGGVIGINEFTFLKSPPARLVSLLTGTMGIHASQQDGWETILRSAGFAEVRSSVHRMNLWEQLASHLEADGLKNYLAAMVVGIGDTSIRRTFFNKEMLAAARDFLPYVGYGLYTGRRTAE